MIQNSRQASVSRRTREELLRAAKEADPERRSSYLELAEQIARELAEYEAIESGQINLFDVASIDELGESLVKARLARGWNHRKLAEALGVSEQMVQKGEARLYENSGLARIAEIADVLGYALSGSFRPVHLPVHLWRPVLGPITVGIQFGFTAGTTWTGPLSVASPTWGLWQAHPFRVGSFPIPEFTSGIGSNEVTGIHERPEHPVSSATASVEMSGVTP